MSKFLKRWLLYFFVPTGLVLLFFPLNTHRLEDIEKNFIFLKISETLITKDGAVALKFTLDTSDDKAMKQLGKELQKMEKLFSEETTTVNPYGYPILYSNDLVSYPSLQHEIENIMRMISLYNYEKTRLKRLDSVSVEEWNRFRKTFLSNTNAFQYGNRIFRDHMKLDNVSADVEISNLKLGCRVIGVIFLLLGLLLLRGLYTPSSNGIQIGKRTTMIIWDILIIMIAVIFTLALIDGILVQYFQTAPLWGDAKMAFFMGIFWVVFANPIMALFTTATAVQTVWITQKGITVKSLFGQKSMAWPDVENMKISEFFSPRKVYGFYAPRKVMKVLNIQGSVSVLRIMEPPLISTKEEIINMLIVYAPKELKRAIHNVSEEWLSIW